MYLVILAMLKLQLSIQDKTKMVLNRSVKIVCTDTFKGDMYAFVWQN